MLVGDQDIVINSEDETARKRARYISDADWIKRRRQSALFSRPSGIRHEFSACAGRRSAAVVAWN